MIPNRTCNDCGTEFTVADGTEANQVEGHYAKYICPNCSGTNTAPLVSTAVDERKAFDFCDVT